MKLHRLLTLGAFFALFTTLHAQEWAPLGAQWHYCQGAGLGEPICGGHYLREVEKDTIVDGIACRKLKNSQVNWQGVYSDLAPDFTYEQNDSVYFYNPEWHQFQLRFDFSAAVGDTVEFPVPGISPWGPQDSTFLVRVDSISLLQGLRVFHVSSLEINGMYPSWVFPGGEYIETVGGKMFQTPFPSITIPEVDGFILCYADQNKNLKFSNQDCDYVLSGWFGKSPVWHYEYFSWGSIGYERMELDDNLVYFQGHLCNTVNRTTAYKAPWGGPVYVSLDVPRYVYDEEDVVYVWQDQDSVFQKMYDFNMQAGDTLKYKPSFCFEEMGYVVTQTGFVEISGKTLRYQQARTLYSSLYGQIDLYIVERIGVTAVGYNTGELQPGGYFFLDDWFVCVTDFPFRAFRCYADAEIPTYQVSPEPCDFITDSKEPQAGINIQISPNPTSDYLSIKLDYSSDAYDYQIINALGQVLLQGKLQGQGDQISVACLPAGVYQLQVRQAEKTGRVSFVKN